MVKMKKVLIATLMVFLTASSSMAGIVIKIQGNIGRKSEPATCPGFGLCSIDKTNAYIEGMVNGTLDVNEDRGSMIVGLYEKDILKVQPDKMVYFKDKISVIFTEDFVMPAEINAATKASKPLVIKKGEIPLTYRNGMYYFEIPL